MLLCQDGIDLSVWISIYTISYIKRLFVSLKHISSAALPLGPAACIWNVLLTNVLWTCWHPIVDIGLDKAQNNNVSFILCSEQTQIHLSFSTIIYKGNAKKWIHICIYTLYASVKVETSLKPNLTYNFNKVLYWLLANIQVAYNYKNHSSGCFCLSCKSDLVMDWTNL